MGKAKRQEFNSVNHCVTKTKTTHRRLGHFQILPKHAKMVKGNVLPIDLLGVRIVLLPSAIAQQFFVV